ncbi:type II toxin-antitoxin system RelE/ParE family toxin [Jatrophihabitans sp. DSM 44399]|uniref:Type II toxin-antitoxin system RelE/ParE family toxin n=2 Tax=Jatrophihabitans lederbergiae TaxID=3075547 RepID=A0ABU2JGV2_9ACTN|nr:type II toxin-antitoxin system RelE/ParE family toxin [Jatrophihabitans sp. DSM 44399]MDT0264194.1 type II toxin-antitoxin system RelE/ParE family toxin [Jatrophihabitans sp. DSM 44399]
MDVGFRNAQLRKLCSDPSLMRRRFGANGSAKLQRRLAELAAATCIADLFLLRQARCHQLKAGRDEMFSVDIDGGLRMIFEVADEPTPRTKDGGVDVDQVKRVAVVEITDPHR